MPYLKVLKMALLVEQALILLKMNRKLSTLAIHNYNVIKNRDLLILKAYPNVIVTPHAAFYTDQVSYDMVHCSLESLKELINHQECRYQLN